VDGSICAEDIKRAVSEVESGKRERRGESYCEEKLLMDVSDKKEVH
jgi:hypothetical protein